MFSCSTFNILSNYHILVHGALIFGGTTIFLRQGYFYGKWLLFSILWKPFFHLKNWFGLMFVACRVFSLYIIEGKNIINFIANKPLNFFCIISTWRWERGKRSTIRQGIKCPYCINWGKYSSFLFISFWFFVGREVQGDTPKLFNIHENKEHLSRALIDLWVEMRKSHKVTRDCLKSYLITIPFTIYTLSLWKEKKNSLVNNYKWNQMWSQIVCLLQVH